MNGLLCCQLVVCLVEWVALVGWMDGQLRVINNSLMHGLFGWGWMVD